MVHEAIRGTKQIQMYSKGNGDLVAEIALNYIVRPDTY